MHKLEIIKLCTACTNFKKKKSRYTASCNFVAICRFGELKKTCTVHTQYGQVCRLHIYLLKEYAYAAARVWPLSLQSTLYIVIILSKQQT